MATSKQIEQEAYVWKKLGQAGFGMDSNRPEAPLGPEPPRTPGAPKAWGRRLTRPRRLTQSP